jgi:autotransporter-associated beta strand protein
MTTGAFNTTVGSLAGGGASGGNVTLSTGGSLTAGANNTTTTYGGVMSGGGSFTKTGGGDMTLTQAATYTGTTTVNNGRLEMNGLTGTSGVTVAETGGTLANAAVLAGTGSIGGSVTVGAPAGAAVGIIAPGGNFGADKGTMNITGGLTVNNDSQIHLNITTATTTSAGYAAHRALNPTNNNAATYLATLPGDLSAWNAAPANATDHDFINLSGTLTIGDRGPTTNYGDGSVFVSGTVLGASNGQVFNILNWDPLVSSIQGVFSVPLGGNNGIYDATTNVVIGDLDLPGLGSGFFWDVSAFKSFGVVVVVPEPSRMMLFLFGFLALFFRRRRSHL